jgi:hypothetical protein
MEKQTARRILARIREPEYCGPQLGKKYMNKLFKSHKSFAGRNKKFWLLGTFPP